MAKELTGFQKNLILYRKATGLTQRELAEKLNISPTTLGGYENAGKDPKIATLIKMADFFGVSVDELVRGNGDKLEELARKKRELSKSILALSPDRLNLFASLVQVAEEAKGTPTEGGGVRYNVTVDNTPINTATETQKGENNL